MVLCAGGIFLLDTLKNKFKYKVVFGQYHRFTFIFIVFVFLSSLWAKNGMESIAKARTLLEIFIITAVIYNHYNCNVEKLLASIKWSCFVIICYSLLYYGGDLLLTMSNMGRLDNSFANANTIGIFAAVGALIQIEEVFAEKKLKWAMVFLVPSIVILSVTQSRKAFVMLLVGCALIFFFYSVRSKKIFNSIFKIFISVLLLGLLIYGLCTLPMFAGMMKRMAGLVSSFTNLGKVDNSTKVRNAMIEIGWTQFLKTPIAGIGIGNTHILLEQELGMTTYLHNNFIELLASGGLIGFFIYYFPYGYLLLNFWKYKKYKNREYVICFILMCLLLVMDWGRVSYYNKFNYVFLILYFFELEQLKREKSKKTMELDYEK